MTQRLKFRTESGFVEERFEVGELLEVDGQPYKPEMHADQVVAISHLSGRLDALQEQVNYLLGLLIQGSPADSTDGSKRG